MSYKVGVIGNGWRTRAFLKVMQELPHIFEFGGMFFRDSEKASKFAEKNNGLAFTDKDTFFSQGFDFVIVAIPRAFVVDICEEAFRRGVPVLCETPPGKDIADLSRMYALKQKYSAKVQVLEQYFCQPYHSAMLEVIDSGKLGDICNVSLSMIHDYHAISMMRKYLGVAFGQCTISGEDFTFPATPTCSREGMNTTGEVVDVVHRRATFKFDNGKVAFYDFNGQQYFSYIRTRHALLQGTRGEIADFSVCYLDNDNYPISATITRADLGHYSNLEGYTNRGLTLNGEFIYKNPYEGARLHDDEIAIATIMEGMGKYANGGEEIYPLEDALQDSYLHLTMAEAVATRRTITTQPQEWHK